MQKLPIISISVLVFLFIFSFLGEFIYDVSAYELNPSSILLNPSLEYMMGSDRLGRDVLARVIQGSKISIIIGLSSAIATSFIGLIIGISAGYFKGVVDKFVIFVIDFFLTFPTLFLLLTLTSYMNASVLILIIVISLTGWMSMARIIRSESFKANSFGYIKILKIAKVSSVKIIFKYLTPLVLPFFFISFIFGFSGAILAESSLSFLGLGVNAPDISLGLLIAEGKELLSIAWWVSFFPGLFIFLLTFSLVQISSYLQYIFNQKST